MKQLALAILLALFGVSLAHAQTTTPTVQQQTQSVWLDVRSADEFATRHIKGAINLPPDQLTTHIERLIPNKSTPINIYCRSGRRATIAQDILQNMGYTHVVNRGGLDDIIKQAATQ